MKELIINKTYRITRADELNLSVSHLKEVTTKPNRYVKHSHVETKWIDLGYFSNVSQACNRIIESAAIESLEGDDCKKIVETIERVKEEIVLAVSDSGLTLDSFTKKEDNRGRKSGTKVVDKVDEKNSNQVVKKKRGRPAKV